MSDYNNGLDLGDPNDFINGMNGNNGEAPNAPVVPEKIGEFETTKYFSAMANLTEGQVDNYEKFKEIVGLKPKYQELEKKYQELEAKSSISPYANDLSKGIDEMLRKGATMDEVNFFVQMQKIDTSAISDGESLRLAKKLSLPGVTDAQVDEWYKDTYGEDGDELTGSQIIRIKEDAKAARDILAKTKVEAGQPPEVLKQKQVQAQFEQRHSFWANVAEKAVVKEKMGFEVPLGKDKDGNESVIKYDFPIPDASRKEISAQLANWAARSGLGKSKEDFQKTQEMYERFVFAAHGKEIVANAVRHAKAAITQTLKQQEHNIDPLSQRGKGDPAANRVEDENAAAEKQAFARRMSKG